MEDRHMYCRTELHDVCQTGDGAHVNARDDENKTALQYAVIHGPVEYARALIIDKGADVNDRYDEDWTPLHYAIFHAQVDIARLLIDEGADVKAATVIGATPLHMTALMGEPEVADLLIFKGAEVDAADGNRATPLHYASMPRPRSYIALGQECPSPRKKVLVAKMLVAEKAAPCAETCGGSTPLQMALTHNSSDVAKLLLDSYVDLRVEEAALKLMVSMGMQELFLQVADREDLSWMDFDTLVDLIYTCVQFPSRDLERLNILVKLLETLPDFDLLQERNGHTVFSLACRNGLAKVAGHLLSRSGHQLINRGTPHPLWLTVHHEQVQVLETAFLSAEGICRLDMDATAAPDGTTPLMMAALKRSKKLLALMRPLYSQEDFLRLAVASGKDETVTNVVECVKSRGARAELASRSQNIKLEGALEPDRSSSTTTLTRMSRRFPKFNDAVETPPEKHLQNEDPFLPIYLTIRNMILGRTCALGGSIRTDVLTVADMNLQPCTSDCKKKLECDKSRKLLTVCQRLEEDVKANSRLGSLCPKFILIGSVAEGTRLINFNEIDVTVKFAALESQPLRLLNGDATKVVVPSGVPLLREFAESDRDDHVLDYARFFTFLLTELESALKRLEMPEGLAATFDWRSCGECDRISTMQAKSVYSPSTHCTSCLPAVSHSRIGPCLMFRDQSGSALTVDLIPVFSLKQTPDSESARTGLCLLFDSVTKTLLEKKPENWDRHLKGFVARDRILPEAYVDQLAQNAQEDVYDVSIKLLNYGKEDNYVIRPGQQLRVNDLDDARLREVYVYVKGVKVVFGVAVSSYFCKKVLLNQSALRQRLAAAAEWNDCALSEAVCLVLSDSELEPHFGRKVSLREWRDSIRQNVAAGSREFVKIIGRL